MAVDFAVNTKINILVGPVHKICMIFLTELFRLAVKCMAAVIALYLAVKRRMRLAPRMKI